MRNNWHAEDFFGLFFNYKITNSNSRYLYEPIERFKQNRESIFEKSDGDKLNLKSTIRVHFYTSFAPCGDSALFSSRDQIYEGSIRDEHECPLTTRAQGQLRSKIENGLIIFHLFLFLNELFQAKEQFPRNRKAVFFISML